ncbi:MAG: hypothetical protein HOO99_18160 [Hyphomicrobiaceae bacterium]|nr:hypothetical protein [Hyphomicrobiaceae bacterium]
MSDHQPELIDLDVRSDMAFGGMQRRRAQVPGTATVRKPAERRWPGWCWGLGGFMLGMVFWHFIGFWGFLNAVLFAPAARDRAQNERPASGDARAVPSLIAPLKTTGPVRATRAGPGGNIGAPVQAPQAGIVSWGAVVQSDSSRD